MLLNTKEKYVVTGEVKAHDGLEPQWYMIRSPLCINFLSLTTSVHNALKVLMLKDDHQNNNKEELLQF